ncbi:LysM peptidoglycan-binding domain-containing protein [Paenibacillus sp. 1P03SA]|uniref:LysM peptidoglycan-binding domain-containing protein n=1 Tax=Paenibacillus sp. 1P03SA TaxID=3132294 RepID=UPI0039A3A053
MEFWLSYNNLEESFQLPVNPPSIKISGSHGFQDIEVDGLGEYTIIGDGKLKEVSISSFFPRDYNPVYCEHSNIQDPWFYVETIQKWVATRRPIRLVITGTPVNMAVTVRSFNVEADRNGSVGDIYYELSLKEYVFIDFSRQLVKSETGNTVQVSTAAKRPDPAQKPKSYKVKSGDNLWKIAQRIYGDGSKYKKIYDANKGKIGKDPGKIYAGMELVIP